MKMAIMQPYIFPYIGYFQLINSVDKFVVYDDVAFIKQGWINRNQILLNGTGHLFTVPLKNASSFTNISKTEINNTLYETWRDKFLKTLVQAYKKAPFFESIYELVSGVIDREYTTISELAANSLVETSRYLNIKTEFLFTSADYGNNELKAVDRVIDICIREGADTYINPVGGKELYSKEAFEKHGLTLFFVKTKSTTYKQYTDNFVPWLSIIDLMMFNSKDRLSDFINDYDLI